MEAPARRQHPVGFAEHGVLVRGEADDAVADDHINAAVGEGDVLQLAGHKLHIGEAHAVAVGVGEGKHIGGHIQPENPARFSHLPGGDEAVNAAAGAQVEDGFAGSQIGEGEGVAAAGGGGHSGHRQALQLGILVEGHSAFRVRGAAADGGSGGGGGAVGAAAGAVSAVVGAAAGIRGRGGCDVRQINDAAGARAVLLLNDAMDFLRSGVPHGSGLIIGHSNRRLRKVLRGWPG